MLLILPLQLLLNKIIEVDNQFNEIYFNEKLVDEAEKLLNKIKLSLEKGNIKEDEWNDENKLCSCINNCINKVI